MHFKQSQRPSILADATIYILLSIMADANNINRSLDNQLAFFTHLRIVFNLNVVNIKRLPPLIYHFNFYKLFFTLFKKKTCENETTYTSRSTNKWTVPSSRSTHGVHGQSEFVTSDHVTQALVATRIFTEALPLLIYGSYKTNFSPIVK
jgi:hypothetical protein